MPPASVLVADDQPHIIDALRLLLKSEGYEIAVADSPHAVLEALRRQTHDVVLMDLNYARDTTSGQEGLDLIGEIRGVDDVTPIVVMTAWSTVRLAVDAMQRGARDFVQKPWDNDRLLAILRTQTALGRASRRSAMLEARLRADLELAAHVQQLLLPQTFPHVPSLDCAAACIPAAAVGGDYYDVVALDGGCVGLAVGDIAGKGVAAALLMANLQALLRTLARTCQGDVARLAVDLNGRLFGTMPSNRYVTFFYGVYDGTSGELRYANAGHNPPLVVRADGRLERLTDGGPVLGLIADPHFATATCRLVRGDALVVFTDGMTEGLNGHDEEFGDDRLVAATIAARRSTADAAGMRDALLADHARFTGVTPPRDDRTLIVARVV